MGKVEREKPSEKVRCVMVFVGKGAIFEGL